MFSTWLLLAYKSEKGFRIMSANQVLRRAGRLLALLTVCATPLVAVETIEIKEEVIVPIDLSVIAPGDGLRKFSIAAGHVVIKIENKVPVKKKYEVAAKAIRTLDPGIELPSGVFTPMNAAPPLGGVPTPIESAARAAYDTCFAVRTDSEALAAVTTEGAVKDKAKKLQGSIKACEDNPSYLILRGSCESRPADTGCDTYRSILSLQERARILLSKTVEVVAIELEPNEDLELTIATTDESQKPQSWRFMFSTPGEKRWFVSYGFALAKDDDETYFTKPIDGEDGKYAVVRETDDRDKVLVPAVMFNYVAASGKSADFLVAGGLGVDSSEVTPFLGLGLSVGKNLSLLVGATARQSARLKGRYDPGVPIGEDLDGASLIEKTYKPYLFVSLGFRFDNPPASHRKTTD